MRPMDVERLAASYGLTIDTLGSLMYVKLTNWKFAWGPDGLWDLLPAPNAMITFGTFVPDRSLSPEKIDEHSNPEGYLAVDHKVVNFVRNNTYYRLSLEIHNLDKLKQFFDDFYAKWAERRKIHKIQEISSIADRYTV